MSNVIDLVVIVLAWLALPVILVVLYDKFALEPQRPKLENGERAPGPAYTRIAGNLLPFVILAAVVRIGVSDVFAWAKEVSVPLSWAAIPVGLWCAIDSWIFAPRRQIAAGSIEAKDPALVRAAYAVLPVLVVAVIIRMISAETLDFSLVLFLLSVVTGLVWLVDHLVFRKQRDKAMALPEPGTVDYARSFFPVAFIVLIVRAFIFEPFRIPSDSMMPTLLDGDFIVVNKYAYGLRLPVLNEKFLSTGTPQRGDVVVFRYPPKPQINYIKRLVGLPGDRVEVHADHLVINGEIIQLQSQGDYVDGCYVGFKQWTETLGEHTHRVMSCPNPYGWTDSRFGSSEDGSRPAAACDRKEIQRRFGAYHCPSGDNPGAPDRGDHVFEVVPAGHYLMIGDNRDNSEDGRAWGFVPDENLVGKATRIWFNFDLQRSSWVNWGRIGTAID